MMKKPVKKSSLAALTDCGYLAANGPLEAWLQRVLADAETAVERNSDKQ